MNHTPAFDPIGFAKRLEDGGFSLVQAETLAKEQAAVVVSVQAVGARVDELRKDFERRPLRGEVLVEFKRVRQENADPFEKLLQELEAFREETKTEFAELRREIAAHREQTKVEFARVRVEIRASGEAVQATILKWLVRTTLFLVSVMIGLAGLAVTLFKLL